MSTTSKPTNPFGQRPAHGHTLVADTSQPARRRRSWSGRHRPVRNPRIQAVCWAVVAIVMITLTISCAHGAARSSYTQSHGVALTGTLGPIVNTTSCGRSSCGVTFAAPVLLSTPVDGHVISTLHGPGRYSAPLGDQVDVLVDPKDPGYAELPGHRLDSSSTWLILAAATLGLGVVPALAVWRLARIRRLRRRRSR
jgi:hypothetical protein